MPQNTVQTRTQVSLDTMPTPGLLARYRRPILALTLLGILVSTATGYSWRWPGISDFTSLMAGGHLAGSPQLYDAPANLEVQRRMTGQSDITRVFPRLPWVALLVEPLKFLPYRSAVCTWRVLMIACLAVFVAISPDYARWATALALSWSTPVVIGLLQGQDCALLLCLLGLSLRAFRTNRHFTGGLLLALCSLKVHFLILVPLVLLIRKEWRALRGVVAGAAGLIAISFAAQGPLWPFGLAGVLRQNYNTGLVLNMPNLYGLYHGSWPIQLIASTGVVFCVAIIAKYGKTDLALCAALAGAFLIAPHAYLQDVLVLTPLAVAVMAYNSWTIRLLGLVACCPLPIGAVLAASPLGIRLLAASILCFLIMVAVEIQGIAGWMRNCKNGNE